MPLVFKLVIASLEMIMKEMKLPLCQAPGPDNVQVSGGTAPPELQHKVKWGGHLDT
jgi:hypothetical protein